MRLIINGNQSRLMTAIAHQCRKSDQCSEEYHILLLVDDEESTNETHVRTAPSGTTIIKYEGIYLTIQFKITGPPQKQNCRHFDYFREIVISADCTRAFMEKFCENAMSVCDIFTDTLQDSPEPHIGIYEWDYGWHKLCEKDLRALDKLYLSSKLEKQVKHFFNQVEYFKTDECYKRYKELCIPHKKILMMSGPPGTGKTSLIHAIATEFSCKLGVIEFTPDLSDKQMRNALRKFPKKTIVVIEDIDCLFDQRKNHDDHKNAITFSGLLNALDGIITGKNCFIILTTNHLEKLDQALTRRIDFFIEFDYATKKQIEKILIAMFPQSDHIVISECADIIAKVKTTVNIVQKYCITKFPMMKVETVDNVNDFKDFNNSFIKEEKELYT
jgi:chaperone BCS1